MLDENKENLLYQIFLEVDDFCRELEKFLHNRILTSSNQARNRPKPHLRKSELLTILIFYHYSGYKCFQYFYKELWETELRTFFPNLVSYNRFIELIPSCFFALLFNQVLCLKSRRDGIYFIDSKKSPICDNRRIHSNRVFSEVAQRGKSSTGWFYGLKLHLVVNPLGKIIQFLITPANIADISKFALDQLSKNLKGKFFGHKGYLSSLFEYYYEKGIQIITKIRKT